MVFNLADIPDDFAQRMMRDGSPGSLGFASRRPDFRPYYAVIEPIREGRRVARTFAMFNGQMGYMKQLSSLTAVFRVVRHGIPEQDAQEIVNEYQNRWSLALYRWL